jgi:hypothetical protein
MACEIVRWCTPLFHSSISSDEHLFWRLQAGQRSVDGKNGTIVYLDKLPIYATYSNSSMIKYEEGKL